MPPTGSPLNQYGWLADIGRQAAHEAEVKTMAQHAAARAPHEAEVKTMAQRAAEHAAARAAHEAGVRSMAQHAAENAAARAAHEAEAKTVVQRAAVHAALDAEHRTQCKSYSSVVSMYGPSPERPRADLDFCTELHMTAPQLKCLARHVLEQDFHGPPLGSAIEKCRSTHR